MAGNQKKDTLVQEPKSQIEGKPASIHSDPDAVTDSGISSRLAVESSNVVATGQKKISFFVRVKNIAKGIKVFFTEWLGDIAFFVVLLQIQLLAKFFWWLTSLRFFPKIVTRIFTPIFSPMYTFILRKNRRDDYTINRINIIDMALKNMAFKKSRSVVTIGGMALGIGAIVFLVSLGYGVNRLVVNQVARLEEMQQTDVTTQPGSQMRLNDASLAKITDIPKVDKVLPLISVVARVNYNNSVSDVPVYGVTRDYLQQSAIKPTRGTIFESNTLAKAMDPILVGEVAGVSDQTQQYVDYDQEIRTVQIEIESGTWIRVRSGPSTNAEIIGYTKAKPNANGMLVGTEHWGDAYDSSATDEELALNENSVAMNRWIKASVPLWNRVECEEEASSCTEISYVPIKSETGEQVEKFGYFAKLGVEVDFFGELPLAETQEYVENDGQVLGDTDGVLTSIDISELSYLASAAADLELAAIASSAGITDEKSVKTVELAESAEKKAVVNSAMLTVLGLSEQEAIGKVFETTFILTGAVKEEEKIESTTAQYEIIGVVADGSTPYFYVPFIDLRGLGVNSFSQIKVVSDNQRSLADVRRQIESMGYATDSVADTVQQIDSLFGTIRSVLAVLGMVALAVASLGMFNTLTVSLMERTREVGLMKAMGMKSHEIRDLFLTESMIMGFFGGIAGIVFGFIGGKLLGFILSTIAILQGQGFIDVSYIPPLFVTVVFFLSLFVGIITGIYPARRATSISALDALRYE